MLQLENETLVIEWFSALDWIGGTKSGRGHLYTQVTSANVPALTHARVPLRRWIQVLACDLTAIGEGERPWYQNLCARLRTSILEHRELPDGYAFRLDSNSMPLVDTAQWISLERLCCPFLTFRVQMAGNESDFWLSVQGPAEAKAIIAESFGATIRKNA